ncbi:TetR/AcrR family transcriptional regulator [Gulosibacter macacae]|uniref:TetR/AcrR family transcriptional regulator n=1 Tax=Gulosibacter macacae TaxID=2488791 RepID=A0A3P3W1I6_9MICO|nr:TetR/AcrR family transcriptional regulator [Gulosibacter macacae]RRJ88840.1 TetR/AcrR family transcriptional regulator [Gulosibacter macacae]
MSESYHHGDVRAAFLRRTAEIITASGVAAVSMRAIAADIGVSHAAPRHHFGSRDGLLTALAAEGFNLMAAKMQAVREREGSYLEIGVAYVEFALEHPGHFAVMFDTDQQLDDDAELRAAQARAFGELTICVERFDDERAKADMAAATIAGWSMMHGLVVLHRSGSLDRAHVTALLGNPSMAELAERVGNMLYGSPPEPSNE